MEIPKWVPEEGAEYLAWFHKLLTRIANHDPPDEHMLRQKIQMVERLARHEDMRLEVIEPLKRVGFNEWRGFYGCIINACCTGFSETTYPFIFSPAKFKCELDGFIKTAKELINRWDRLCISGTGYSENWPIEDSYKLYRDLRDLVAEVEPQLKKNLTYYWLYEFHIGHHKNFPRDSTAARITKYLKEATGGPKHSIVAAILRISRLDCNATQETVRAIWRRCARPTGENLPQNS